MRPDRPKFTSNNPLKAPLEEIKPAFEGFDAYCGTYTVDTERKIVVHHVLGSKLPNWIGTDQERPFELSGGQLLIKGPLFLNGERWDFEVVWKRF